MRKARISLGTLLFVIFFIIVVILLSLLTKNKGDIAKTAGDVISLFK